MSKKQLKLQVPPVQDAEKIAREHIPAEMFEQVADKKIFDQNIEGEAIGFFKDAFMRFKKIRLQSVQPGLFSLLFLCPFLDQ